MKKFLAILTIIIFLSTGIVTSAYTMSNNEVVEELNNERNYYAVIVGVETFQGNLSYENIVCIDEDAQGIYAELINSKNWKEENIKILINENASKKNIQNSITEWLDERENESDVVLFYYSGHGWRMPLSEISKGHAYIFSYNNTKAGFNEGSISDLELDSYFDTLESKNIVIILDCCYSGRMLKLRQNGRIILAAGGKHLFCPVDEDISLGHGIFTYYLLQGFDGVADKNNDGWVSAGEVFHYAKLPTFWFSLWKQFPFIHSYNNNNIRFIGPQIPYIYNRHIGDIPIIQNNNFTK